MIPRIRIRQAFDMESRIEIPPWIYVNDKRYDFAPGIRAIRELLGLNTRALAKILRVSPRTVEGWEQGRKPAEIIFYRLETWLKNHACSKK